MKIILDSLAVVLMLGAFSMYYVSLRTWKKEHPSLDRGAYWPPWRYRDKWEGRSFNLYKWSLVIFWLGAAVAVSSQFLK